ncbi:glycerophosphoryl diester phosphodiesterase membrane domain-containing protein [Streptomyces cellulosae]|nr:glycerophosphoryl diester phosphodiesterase membrane domain-containing protein [Streptomyces cellulosae]
MNDTPGWASPGSAPSDGGEPGTSGPSGSDGRPEPEQSADRPRQSGDAPQEPGVKWSKDQPPAAQWSAPTGTPGAGGPGQAPPPPPGPGWGAPPPGGPGGQAPWGGWGSGWGGPPPAAKPGVIPLRPLGVGELLDGAVSTMRTYWRTVLGISLTLAVLTEIAAVLLQGLVLDDANTEVLNDPSATLGELTDVMGDLLLSSAALYGITLIGTVAATALLTTVTSRAVLGRPVTTGEAWRDARPQVLKLLGLILLLALIAVGVVAVGALPGILVSVSAGAEVGFGLTLLGLVAAAVFAAWLMIRFSLASPALMLEKQGIVTAMRRSARLVRGSWWRVFGIQLLAAIIAYVVAAIIVIPFTFLAAAFSGDGVTGFVTTGGDIGWTFLIISGIGSVIGSMITFPITAGVTVLLYIDQRIRREALDLELARAAGVQGPGATGGS